MAGPRAPARQMGAWSRSHEETSEVHFGAAQPGAHPRHIRGFSWISGKAAEKSETKTPMSHCSASETLALGVTHGGRREVVASAVLDLAAVLLGEGFR